MQIILAEKMRIDVFFKIVPPQPPVPSLLVYLNSQGLLGFGSLDVEYEEKGGYLPPTPHPLEHSPSCTLHDCCQLVLITHHSQF